MCAYVNEELAENGRIGEKRQTPSVSRRGCSRIRRHQVPHEERVPSGDALHHAGRSQSAAGARGSCLLLDSWHAEVASHFVFFDLVDHYLHRLVSAMSVEEDRLIDGPVPLLRALVIDD